MSESKSENTAEAQPVNLEYSRKKNNALTTTRKKEIATAIHDALCHGDQDIMAIITNLKKDEEIMFASSYLDKEIASTYTAEDKKKMSKTKLWAVVSYSNITMQNAMKRATTGLISYLGHRAKIWNVPNNFKPVSYEEYLADPEGCFDPPTFVSDKPTIKQYDTYKQTFLAKTLPVYEFLHEVFGFIPDIHTMSAMVEGKSSVKTRSFKKTPATKVAIIDREIENTKLSKEDSESPAYNIIPSQEHFENMRRWIQDHDSLNDAATHNLYGIDDYDCIDAELTILDVCGNEDDATAIAEYGRNSNQISIAKLKRGVIPCGRKVIIDEYSGKNVGRDGITSNTVLSAMLRKNEEDKKKYMKIMKKRMVRKKVSGLASQGKTKTQIKSQMKEEIKVRNSKGQNLGIGGLDKEDVDKLFTNEDLAQGFSKSEIAVVTGQRDAYIKNLQGKAPTEKDLGRYAEKARQQAATHKKKTEMLAKLEEKKYQRLTEEEKKTLEIPIHTFTDGGRTHTVENVILNEEGMAGLMGGDDPNPKKSES